MEQHLVRFPSDQDALYRLLVLLEQQQCYEQACILYEQTKRVLEAVGKQPAKHVRAYYEHLQRAAQAPAHQEWKEQYGLESASSFPQKIHPMKTPVPIPNTPVTPFSPNDTLSAATRENKTSPLHPPAHAGFFIAS